MKKNEEYYVKYSDDNPSGILRILIINISEKIIEFAFVNGNSEILFLERFNTKYTVLEKIEDSFPF